MENEHENMVPEEPEVMERPRWQVWGARIGLVVLIMFLILYYLTIARGGM